MTQGIYRPTYCVTCKQTKPISYFLRYVDKDGKQQPHDQCKACRPKRTAKTKVCDTCGVEKIMNNQFTYTNGKYKDTCRACYAGPEKTYRTCDICKETKALVGNFSRIGTSGKRYDSCKVCRAPIVREERLKKLEEVRRAKQFLKDLANEKRVVRQEDATTNPWDWRNYRRQINWATV